MPFYNNIHTIMKTCKYVTTHMTYCINHVKTHEQCLKYVTIEIRCVITNMNYFIQPYNI